MRSSHIHNDYWFRRTLGRSGVAGCCQPRFISAPLSLAVAEKELKNTALTHGLAYYKRLQFGKKGEVQSGEQHELFEATLATDLGGG
jgi:hypothetical protein